MKQEARGRDDKYLQVFAMRCPACKSLFSMNFVLRTERTNAPPRLSAMGKM